MAKRFCLTWSLLSFSNGWQSPSGDILFLLLGDCTAFRLLKGVAVFWECWTPLAVNLKGADGLEKG